MNKKKKKPKVKFPRHGSIIERLKKAVIEGAEVATKKLRR